MHYCLAICSSICLALLIAAQPGEDMEPSLGNIVDIGSVGDVRSEFNEDTGVPRLLVLLSPTCPKCVEGAEWIDEHVFAAYPDAPLQVFVVWLPVLPTDKRDRIPDELLRDERARHYWDEERLLGAWLKANSDCPSLEPVAWDAYYLFTKDTEWDEDRLPAPVSCGTPIFLRTEQFTRALKAVLESSPAEEAVVIEVLGFGDCPHFVETVNRVRAVAESVLPDAPIRTVTVDRDAGITPIDFVGSPTVLVNGNDIAGGLGEQSQGTFACRLYDGEPIPSEALLRESIAEYADPDDD